jgi:hypothetical protein
VQFAVDGSKSGARIANGAAAIGQPPKRGYSRMAQPGVGAPTCASAWPGRRCAVASDVVRERPLVGRLAPQMNESNLSFTGPLPTASRRSLPRAVSVHAGAFGDPCEGPEGAPTIRLPGSILSPFCVDPIAARNRRNVAHGRRHREWSGDSANKTGHTVVFSGAV